MDLSIIIVSWQVKEKLKKNIESIYLSKTKYNFEIFVVDNASNDGTVSMLKENFPKVNIIANSKNIGFSSACNQAILKAKGDFILLLNPDMKLYPDTLEKAVLWHRSNNEIVVSGIKLENEKGENILQIRRFPKLLDQLAIIFKIPHFLPGVLNKYLYKDFDYNKSQVVDSIRGSFFLINKLAWQKISKQKLPLLDSKYFLWFEEVDFCKQVYTKKALVYYNSKAKACDLVGQSFSQVNFSKKQKYFSQSMLTYFKKWKPYWQYLIIKIAWSIVFIIIKLKKKVWKK